MSAKAPNMDVLDSLLTKKAGFLDIFRPAAPQFVAPLGMAAKSKRELKKTQEREMELWQQWDQGGRRVEDLEPLYKSYKPFINQYVHRFMRNEIPASAIRAEVNQQFMNAVNSYDPSRSQLNTWVQNNLRKTQRYVKTYQNLGHIPEGQISLITPYYQAKSELVAKFGHEPDTDSIADRMGLPTRKVAQLEKELSRKDLPVSGFGEQGDPAQMLTPKELEAFSLIKYDLTPEERTVYEYTFGVDGKPQLKPGEIAKKAKIHPSKVSRIRKKLKDKVYEAMEVL